MAIKRSFLETLDFFQIIAINGASAEVDTMTMLLLRLLSLYYY